MSTEFADFTTAITRRNVPEAVPGVPHYARVAVLGGGHDARLLAALCLAEQAEVSLFSAYGQELEELRTSSGIGLRGAGPAGTYQIDRDEAVSVKTTAELDRSVADADLIFMTGPVHKQRTYAMVLANHLSDGQVLVLAPGRSLGALETAWLLRIGGCEADITIVETQGLPYWYETAGAVLTLEPAAPVAAATLPSDRPQVLEGLSKFLPNIQAVSGVLASAFADGSAVVEFPALLFGGPATDAAGDRLPMGATPLAENATFRSLLGPEQIRIVASLAAERHQVAAAFGVRSLPDVEQWLTQHAGEEKGPGRRPIPNKADALALLRDGVIGSLVPLVSAATLAGVPVPLTESMINFATAILDADVAAAGRRLDGMGLKTTDVDSVRRTVDQLNRGGTSGH